MQHIEVHPLDILEFDVTIAVACIKKSRDRLECSLPTNIRPADFGVPDYFYKDGSLVVSFDQRWYPFLDNTCSWNPPDRRWYIPKVSRLLRKIGDVMQAPEQKLLPGWRSGGRVFIHSGGVFRRAGSREVELVSWTLPAPSMFLNARIRITVNFPDT
jgi:hypothetical protein